mmetsp:Transcript_21078/g.60949  ORF Transcript_21078/g.60949 Transcript_21078/m.60949 type:complete len:268 (+) Transcript_21078:50-853(+)
MAAVIMRPASPLVMGQRISSQPMQPVGSQPVMSISGSLPSGRLYSQGSPPTTVVTATGSVTRTFSPSGGVPLLMAPMPSSRQHSAVPPPVTTASGVIGGMTRVMSQRTVKLVPVGPATAREQALENQVAELQAQMRQKDEELAELRSMLSPQLRRSLGARSRSFSPRSPSSFSRLSGGPPAQPYAAVDPADPVDVRLEEIYNRSGASLPFKRINKGFYRFGDTLVELDIINSKLMARTEDGWNRGKFGMIEKLISHYDRLERERLAA